LAVRIVAAMGLAQYRESEEGAWKKAERGVTLPLGAELRTGLRSRVAFMVGDEHTITLDRLGVIKVLDAIQQDGKVQTEMGMRYGRASYQVQVGGVEHESKIRTPSATLAVRGSKGFVQEYAGRVPMAGSDYGNVSFVNTQGYEVPLAPETNVEGSQTSAAQQSLSTGTFLPQSGAVTSTEAVVIESQPLFGTPSVGGVTKMASSEETSMVLMNEMGDMGIGEPPIGTTQGFLFAEVGFVSNPLFNAVDVDIVLDVPGEGLVDARNLDPRFYHSGNRVHDGEFSGMVYEWVETDGRETVPIGNYTLIVTNRTPGVNADVQVYVEIATDPVIPSDYFIAPYHGSEVVTVPPLNQVGFEFTVPISTVPE
jgi:hypothetical protein